MPGGDRAIMKQRVMVYTLYGQGASHRGGRDNAIRVAEALVPANALADSLTRGASLATTLGRNKVCS